MLNFTTTNQNDQKRPLLPIKLNRKISLLWDEPDTVSKKIQIPPQATLAVIDAKSHKVKKAGEPSRPMPFETHVPKWTKVNTTLSNFHKKSWSV